MELSSKKIKTKGNYGITLTVRDQLNSISKSFTVRGLTLTEIYNKLIHLFEVKQDEKTKQNRTENMPEPNQNI